MLAKPCGEETQDFIMYESVYMYGAVVGRQAGRWSSFSLFLWRVSEGVCIQPLP